MGTLLGIGLLAGGFWVLAVISVLLAIGALISVFRNTDLSGGAKAMWVVVIVIFPLLGSLVYFGVRSDW
jgi:Phospholipase_D-nuclease N-terminal